MQRAVIIRPPTIAPVMPHLRKLDLFVLFTLMLQASLHSNNTNTNKFIIALYRKEMESREGDDGDLSMLSLHWRHYFRCGPRKMLMDENERKAEVIQGAR